MGGDEFAVVLPQTGLEQAIVVAKKLILSCEKSLIIEGNNVLLGISNWHCTLSATWQHCQSSHSGR